MMLSLEGMLKLASDARSSLKKSQGMMSFLDKQWTQTVCHSSALFIGLKRDASQVASAVTRQTAEGMPQRQKKRRAADNRLVTRQAFDQSLSPRL